LGLAIHWQKQQRTDRKGRPEILSNDHPTDVIDTETVAKSLRAYTATVKRPCLRCPNTLDYVELMVEVDTMPMPYHLVADLILLLHIGFVLFAVLGGFLALGWRWLLWIHMAAVIWAAVVEFFGWICPLTPLENWLRNRAGGGGYGGDFIAHYMVPILYPDGLTREVQIGLGFFVLLINMIIYGWLFYMRRPGNSSRQHR
jgi:hypothetical protein